MTEPTASDLVAESNQLEEHLLAQTKAFADWCKPYKDRLDEIRNLLLAMLNEQGCDSFKTDHGTAYRSVIDTFRMSDREAFLDFVLENWDERGEMLQLSSPKKDAVRDYMETHDGKLPPHVEVSSFTRVNIRKN